MRCLAPLLLGAVLAAAEPVTIPNTMRFAWPWELVSVDLDPAKANGLTTVTGMGDPRPVQMEQLTVEGKPVARAWFIATVEGAAKPDGGREAPPTSLTVQLDGGKAAPGVTVARDGGTIRIGNGLYELRIADYAAGEFPKPLREVRHWLGGVRVQGSPWDGRAWFDGSAVVTGATTEVVANGPVFIDLRITYRFADAGEQGTIAAPPLQLGKQSFRWKPNQIPTETVPKREREYTLLVRATMGDPWIEVVERYRLPKDPSVADFGIHQQYIHFGAPGDNVPTAKLSIPADQFLPLDIAIWERWFEYDAFGGNEALGFHPLTPRPAQKGRPFALIRPRWNQGPGGAQEMLMSSTGVTASEKTPNPDYKPDAPLVGIVAAYASKWVGPYQATIAGSVADGKRGWVRMGLSDGGGGGGNDGASDNNHYGQRCFAIIAGPRRLADADWAVDGLVRRHTDWTLTAQMNKYILDWPRDPAKAGPAILLSKARLAELQKAYAAGTDSVEVALVKEFLAANKDDKKKLDSKDGKLARLIAGESVPSEKGPSPNMYFSRYQTDAVNPTNYGNRRMVNGPFPTWDLFGGGKPIGGADTAAIGYIYSDLDAWPGWHSGWSPGNPNFHTDKYLATLYAGAALADHPHAAEWLAFGRSCLDDDLKRVVAAPDGAGYECPGYSGYSLGMQLDIAKVLYNAGINIIAANPLMAKTGTWHRKLLTPVDVRLKRRHAAPLGDTHRWDSGMGANGFARLALFFKESDPTKAAELMGAWKLLGGDDPKHRDSLFEAITTQDLSIKPADPMTLDWSSQAFNGFGALLRDGFGQADESFLAFKAGFLQGHYHNDELAYHFYSGGTPVSLDYNCSYHPRGDHAGLHNRMTFGKEGIVRNNSRNVDVPAMEQPFGDAVVGAFASTPVADVVVAELTSKTLQLSPLFPEDSEFQRSYPTRDVEPIVHRRLLALIKHPAGAAMQDYLVVRDEVQGRETQQLNVHVLARDAAITGTNAVLNGQWDKDMLFAAVGVDGGALEAREWFYHDEWMLPPEPYTLKAGESQADYAKRMAALGKLPAADWKPRWKKGGKNDPEEQKAKDAAEAEAWEKLIHETKGRALMPPPGWTGEWLYGECQVWLRLASTPGSAVTWVLYPYPKGSPAPTVAALADGAGVSITLGKAVDEVRISTAGGVTVTRGGTATAVIPAGTLPALGALKPLR